MLPLLTTDAHERLRQEVRQFAESEVAPLVSHMESAKKVDRDLARRIAKQGWIGVTIDASYGGMGAGHVAKLIIIEELSRVSGAMGAMAQASQLGTAMILHLGNDEQKRHWLPRIASGDCLPTIAVTDPESGGWVLGMHGTAERDGDYYVLNGIKVHVGNSHIGDIHLVVVRTGEGPGGLTAFLVEADRPGLEVMPQKTALGLHGFSFGELRFHNCRVPAANRIGAEGDGLKAAYSSSVLYGRSNLTGVSLGIHRAIRETTIDHATRTRRNGKPLHDIPAVAAKIAGIQSRLMANELAAYYAAALLDNGQPCDAWLMNAKLTTVEDTITSARVGVEVHAAAGLFTDLPIERLVRDAYHPWAPAGTSDIQLLRLAQHALGQNEGRSDWSEIFAESFQDSPAPAPRRKKKAPKTSPATAPRT